MLRITCVTAGFALASAFMVPAMSPKLGMLASSAVMAIHQDEAAAKAAWLSKVEPKGQWGAIVPAKSAAARSMSGSVVPTGSFAAMERIPSEYPPAGTMFEKEGSFSGFLAENGILHAEGQWGAKHSQVPVIPPTGSYAAMERVPGEYPAAGTMFEKERSFAEFQAANGLLQSDHLDPMV